MVQRSNDAVVQDAQTKSSKEACAEGMEMTSKSNHSSVSTYYIPEEPDSPTSLLSTVYALPKSTHHPSESASACCFKSHTIIHAKGWGVGRLNYI